jgi:hypothetical protein
MSRRMTIIRTDVSEERIASIFRVESNRELGAVFAVNHITLLTFLGR